MVTEEQMKEWETDAGVWFQDCQSGRVLALIAEVRRLRALPRSEQVAAAGAISAGQWKIWNGEIPAELQADDVLKRNIAEEEFAKNFSFTLTDTGDCDPDGFVDPPQSADDEPADGHAPDVVVNKG